LDVGIRSQFDIGGEMAASDKVSAKLEIEIYRERCKGCGFCVEFCPHHVLAVSSEFNSKGYHPPRVSDIMACRGCKFCELACPDFALLVSKAAKQEEEK